MSADAILWQATPDASLATFEVMLGSMDRATMRKAALLMPLGVVAITALVALAGMLLLASAGADWRDGSALLMIAGTGFVTGILVMGLLALPILRRLSPPLVYVLTADRIGHRLGAGGTWDDFAWLAEVQGIQRWTSPGGFRGYDVAQSRQHPEMGLVSRVFQLPGLHEADADALEAALAGLGWQVADRPAT
ncbi:hypothetical protein [Parapedomonas caeni]